MTPRRPLRTSALVALLCAIVAAVGCSDRASTGDADPPGFSRATFADPPREAGPMARWWWPGGAVDGATLRSSLESIADAGYAQVEVQPFLIGLSASDVAPS